MGLSMEDQRNLHAKHNSTATPPTDTPSIIPRARNPKTSGRKITYVTWEGEEVNLQAKDGFNLMEIAKESELPGIEGVCEGKLEVRP